MHHVSLIKYHIKLARNQVSTLVSVSVTIGIGISGIDNSDIVPPVSTINLRDTDECCAGLLINGYCTEEANVRRSV